MFSDIDTPEFPAAVADTQPEEDFSSDAPSAKRNCGRTGPTSEAGKAKSSQNSFKHGACSKTLIQPGEREEDWLLLLKIWTDRYQPEENTLLYTFVLKTAQAEWARIRRQQHLDDFLCQNWTAPYNWSDALIKRHDLMLRYKTSAERCFQREYRQLEQHYKAHPPEPPKPTPEEEAAAAQAIFAKQTPTGSPETAAEADELYRYTPQDFTMEDPTSPTGYTFIERSGGNPDLDRKLGRKIYQRGEPYP